jgi:hypothetical protein
MLPTLALMSMPLLLLLPLLPPPLPPPLPRLPRLPLPLPPSGAAQLPVHVVLAPIPTALQVARCCSPRPRLVPHHCEKPYGE